MVRKDQIRDGFVARTFHIPTAIDEEIRIEAVRKNIRFSDIATVAFEHYLQRDGSTKK